MLKETACIDCGTETMVALHVEESDFHRMMNKMAMQSARCDECEEKAKSEERRQVEEHDRLQKEAYAKSVAAANQREYSGIVGKKYQDASFENYRAETPSQITALKISKEFSIEPKGFLYLHGKPGIGKTHLAVSIFREHAMTLWGYNPDAYHQKRGFREVDFWTVPELLLHLRSLMGADISEMQAISPLLETPMLILDDLGAEKITDWVRQAFYVVISHRERDELPTVITSNLSLGEIEAKVGDERVVSRIGGAARIVRIEGNDERLAWRKR